RLHHHDLAPRRELGRCHVLPRFSAVGSLLDVSVVGAYPDQVRVSRNRRRRNGVNNAAALARRGISSCSFIEVVWHAGIFSRQVGAYLRPVISAVQSLKQKLIAEVQGMRVGLRKDQRESPRSAEWALAAEFRGNIGGFSG